LPKIIILIIDADNEPIYQTGRSIWRNNANMHGIPIYFLRAAPGVVDDNLYIDGDCLYTKWIDNFAHRINDKTFKALQYCFENLEFDYILRTNLSSFYRLNVLIKFLQETPRVGFYAGPVNFLKIEGEEGRMFDYVSGSGILLSRDLIPIVLSKQSTISYDYIDDVWLGMALFECPRHSVARCDFIDIEDVGANFILMIAQRIADAESRGEFHFRIKNGGAQTRFILDSLVFGMLASRYILANAVDS